jgi:tripartite-type tricarboxylate transporter receptor subunit TctC
LPGFDPIGWYAMFAPGATPRALVTRVNAAVNHALQQRDIRERMAANGMVPIGGAPEVLRDYLKSEIERWGKVIKQSGIQPE